MSDRFDVSELLHTLTKLSLFEDASEDSIRVHRMVQDIIQEEVKEMKCLEETLQNIQHMLVKALEGCTNRISRGRSIFCIVPGGVDMDAAQI